MVLFDDYLHAAPHDKRMRENGIICLLHVSQRIIFNQTEFVTATLISEARSKSLYPRLYFKVINEFATSTNFKEDRKRFNYESGNKTKR